MVIAVLELRAARHKTQDTAGIPVNERIELMTMTNKAIWILGDLRTPRLWKESLKVMTKALPLAAESHAPVAMVLMGAADHDAIDAGRIDLSACVDMHLAAGEAVAHGARTVFFVHYG